MWALYGFSELKARVRLYSRLSIESRFSSIEKLCANTRQMLANASVESCDSNNRIEVYKLILSKDESRDVA